MKTFSCGKVTYHSTFLDEKFVFDKLFRMEKTFMKRSAMAELNVWAASQNRMPLVLQGAR